MAHFEWWLKTFPVEPPAPPAPKPSSFSSEWVSVPSPKQQCQSFHCQRISTANTSVLFQSNELRLTEGTYQVVQRDAGEEIPYQIRSMGLYMVIEANNGLMLIWDKKTSIHVKLSPEYSVSKSRLSIINHTNITSVFNCVWGEFSFYRQGRVCGLCGNYDGNANNDFTTRSQALAVDVLAFGNSWKLSSGPDATLISDPCVNNPYREAWAQKQCSVITSSVFSACHPQVATTNSC